MALWKTLLFLLLFLSNVEKSTASNILLVPSLGFGSAFAMIAKMATDLADQGHNLTFLVSSPFCQHAVDKMDTTTVQAECFLSNLDFNELRNGSTEETLTSISNVRAFVNVHNMFADVCDELFRDDVVLHRLQDKNFDLVIACVLSPCGALLGHYLNRPFVLVSTDRMNPVWNAGMYNVPNNPAYIPCLGTGLTDKMTFWDRVYNIAFFIAQYIEFNMALVKFGAIQQKNNIRPDLGIRDLYGDAELFLFNIDFTSSSPRPLMQNTIYLGGYFTEPGRPLDKDLEDFINSSGKHGVVIFSLGTYQVLTNSQFKRFAAALERLPQKVIAKYGGGDTPGYLKNTTKFKLSKWIPQNDLLGHPKTKALVYHGGVNGIQEAIYHAIPVVGMPIFWDQYDNVQLLVERGMAVALDVNTMTSEDLYQATTKVIEDPKYKENALRLSRINRDRQMQPKELFIFWIEYIIRHGGTHLRSQAANLNAFQYYSIDVIAFLTIISMIAGFAILKTCRFLRRVFQAKEKEKKH